MSKAVFPKNLLNKDINNKNRQWIDDYIKNTNYNKVYYRSLENFFRYVNFENKHFNFFTEKDIQEYIEIMLDNNYAISKIDYTISNISSFRSYLIEKYPEFFSEKFLSNLNDLKLGIPEKKYAESKPLNLIQLNSVKQFIKSNIKTEYIFEIFYQLGIEKKDFNVCIPKNANLKNKYFKNKEKEIIFNEKIMNLLEAIAKLDDFKITPYMVNYHLKKIEEDLKSKGLLTSDETLTYNDIIKTHEMFFIKCPNCRKKIEMVSHNWVLAKPETSKNLYLVCSLCKGGTEVG